MTMQAEVHQCAAQVSDHARLPRYTPCTHKGVLEEEGKWWCKQHTPSLVKQRRDANYDAYRQRSDTENAQRRYNAAAGDACRAAVLTADALGKGIVAWLIEQARGREWLPLRGTEGYCPECAHTPNEGHAPFCERGAMFALLGEAEAKAVAE